MSLQKPKRRMLTEDLQGLTFHMLTVPHDATPERRGKRIFWHCVCECGESAVVGGYNLIYGITKSCGCMSRRKMSLGQISSFSPNAELWNWDRTDLSDYSGTSRDRMIALWQRSGNPKGNLGTVVHVQRSQDRSNVALDGLDRQTERVRDFLVSHAPGDEPSYLELARA